MKKIPFVYVKVKKFTCLRCGHKWIKKDLYNEELPRECPAPGCRSVRWDYSKACEKCMADCFHIDKNGDIPVICKKCGKKRKLFRNETQFVTYPQAKMKKVTQTAKKKKKK
jgi:hypothetical protein